MKNILAFFLFTFFCSCASKTPAPLSFSLADSGRTLKFTGIDEGIIGEVGRDSSNQVWQSLISVYKMPADTGMKDYQTPQPGKYQVKGGAVLFTPDTPFVKNQSYFVRYYRYSDDNSIWDYLRHKKKLGRPAFTDLPFKR